MLIKALVALGNLVIKGLGTVANVVVLLLPPSPFLNFTGVEIPFISSLNWVIPISFMVTILGYWTGAILLYYIVQTVLRWVKMIE